MKMVVVSIAMVAILTGCASTKTGLPESDEAFSSLVHGLIQVGYPIIEVKQTLRDHGYTVTEPTPNYHRYPARETNWLRVSARQVELDTIFMWNKVRSWDIVILHDGKTVRQIDARYFFQDYRMDIDL